MEFFWQLTLLWNDHSGTRYSSREGVIDARLGETREDLTYRVHKEVRDEVGAPKEAVTLFFSLDPNELFPHRAQVI